MNIFILDRTPEECARAHCDTHVKTQVRDAAQMLSICHRVVDGEPGDVIFERGGKRVLEARPILRHLGEYDGMRSTGAEVYWDCYHDHPCNVWLRESKENYEFLWSMFSELARQHRVRFKTTHGSYKRLGARLATPPDGLPSRGLTRIAQAVPAALKMEPGRGPGFLAYRRYYLRLGDLYYKNANYGTRDRWPGYNLGVEAPTWLQNDRFSIHGRRW